MRKWWPVPLVLSLLLAQPLTAQARTWRVERYGPADFSTIQPALDAAAPGDTILIGYGRYTEYQTVTLPGWNWAIRVYAWVHTSDLTIMGVNRTGVVIGPASPAIDQPHFSPKGIVALNDVHALTISDLTVENTYTGLYCGAAGPVELSDCTLKGNECGTFYWGTQNFHVHDCLFMDSTLNGLGIWADSPGQTVLIEDSVFMNIGVGVSFGGGSNATVARCAFTGGGIGIQYASGSFGTISDCQISDFSSPGVVATTGATVRLDRCTIENGPISLNITWSDVSGSGNLFAAGSASTVIMICNPATRVVELHGNHIVNQGHYSVRLICHVNPPDAVIDMSGNYWGTDDLAQISAWIWDGYDDPAIHGFVDFEPIADGPVSTEPGTWGGVKALYRGVEK